MIHSLFYLRFPFWRILLFWMRHPFWLTLLFWSLPSWMRPLSCPLHPFYLLRAFPSCLCLSYRHPYPCHLQASQPGQSCRCPYPAWVPLCRPLPSSAPLFLTQKAPALSEKQDIRSHFEPPAAPPRSSPGLRNSHMSPCHWA